MHLRERHVLGVPVHVREVGASLLRAAEDVTVVERERRPAGDMDMRQRCRDEIVDHRRLGLCRLCGGERVEVRGRR